MRDSQIARVIAAMERHLDVLDKQRELIPTRAERLVLVVGLAQFNDQPGAQEGGRLTVQRELLSLIKLGEKLHNQIETMHRDSLDLLADLAGVRHPYLIANDLKHLLQAIPTAAIPTTPAHKGNRVKQLPRQVAQIAVRDYTELTGRKATVRKIERDTPERETKRGGPFVTFLEEIFDALGIEADAGYYAEAVLYQKTPPKKDQ